MDGQRAVEQPAAPAGGGRDRIGFAAERRPGPGWHVVTYVVRAGGAPTAEAAGAPRRRA